MTSRLLTITSGVRGEVPAHGAFSPVCPPKTEQFFSHTVMGDSPILPGGGEEAGGHLSAGFCQGLARLVSALN